MAINFDKLLYLNVLLVESNEDNIDYFIETLKNEEITFEISHSLNADDAILKLSNNSNKFNLIVSNYNLSDISGLDFFEKLSEMSNRTPFVLIIEEYEENIAHIALQTGVDDYIFKKKNKPYYSELVPIILKRVVVRYNENISYKQSLLSLKELRARYNALMEAVDDMIYICSSDHKIVYMNPALVKRIDYDATGKLCHEVIYGLDKKCNWCTIESSNKSYKRKDKIIHPKDGRYYQLSHFPIRNIDGSISTMNIFKDITERKKMEEELLESETKYRTILENIEDGFYEVDITGSFTFVNDSMTKCLGYPKDELIGMNNRQYMDQENAKKLYQNYNKVYLTGKSTEVFEWEVITKDGSKRFIEGSVSMMKDNKDNTAGFRGIIRDITTRKRVEDGLKKAKLEAETANRELIEVNRELEQSIARASEMAVQAEMASLAKNQFLANMSHEIRTPLNAIIGMTDIVLETKLASDQREYLNLVRFCSDSLLEVINEILDFSKIEAGELHIEEIDLDLQKIAGETMKALGIRAYQKGLDLAYYIAPDVPQQLFGDPTRLKQIIVNLIGNALKFTETGEIILEIKKEWEKDDEVCLHFTVTDSGIGVPIDKQKLIFEAFAQADGTITRKYGGTGLGLAICNRLVDAMGGKIWIESPARENTENQGSIFHFTALFKLNTQNFEKKNRFSIPELKGISILLLENNIILMEILRKNINNWGMIPTTANKGKEAIIKLKEALSMGNPFPLVIFDEYIYKKDEMLFIEALDTQPELIKSSIMILTPSNEKDETFYIQPSEICISITKPLKESELFEAIKSAMGYNNDKIVESESINENINNISHLKILLAEDNEMNQKVASNMLEKLGHSVKIVNNGHEAIEILNKEKFDLVLMDGQMPVMDGINATKEIRKKEKELNTRHIPIVALTAHAMKGDRERFLAAGMDDYVSKPIKKDDLAAVIKRCIDGKIIINENGINIDLSSKAAESSDPIDIVELMEIMDGNEELLKECFSDFINNSLDMLTNIKKSIIAGDAVNLDKNAHRFKGTLKYLAARPASAIAYQLEIKGKEGDLTNTEEIFHSLLEECERIKNFMLKY